MNQNTAIPVKDRSKLLFSMQVFTVVIMFLVACTNSGQDTERQLARTPDELQQKTSDIIKKNIELSVRNNGKIDDSLILSMSEVVKEIYENNQFKPAWEQKGKWEPIGDSLFNFIDNSKLYGLFPEDYHYLQLVSIRNRFDKDSLGKNDRSNAALWARADLMMTDAFLLMVKDLKLGRLPQDSITLRTDSVLTPDFYRQQFSAIQSQKSLYEIVRGLEPKHPGYHQLKAGIRKFLDSADYREYVKVPLPKVATFRMALQQRLFQGGFISFDSTRADSAQLSEAVKKFQKHAGANADGRVGEVTIRLLNTSDRERFIRIAITMDRYKMLPEKMPDRYLWVNLPGYYLQLIENDAGKLYSKIICGKPITRSPVLTSAISELITYPQWTIPQSIIQKEILPAAKRNPDYITKKGFSLFDSKGNQVPPDSVDWSKYTRGIPYRVVQGSGDANALGVLKFNFSNKYAVYLHDTNQRYLFSSNDRAMSHGCIRVQNWDALAFDIIRKEEIDGIAKEDSVRKWLKHKQKRSFQVKNKLPLFIRYFTCEGKNGSIVFYDDIYGEDKMLQEKYFTGK